MKASKFSEAQIAFVLKQTDDDALKLTNFVIVVSDLGHRIQFIQKQHQRLTA